VLLSSRFQCVTSSVWEQSMHIGHDSFLIAEFAAFSTCFQAASSLGQHAGQRALSRERGHCASSMCGGRGSQLLTSYACAAAAAQQLYVVRLSATGAYL